MSPLFKPGFSDVDFKFQNRPWIYVASPYTNGDAEVNVARQMEAKLELLKLDTMPILPLPGSHYFHTHFCELTYRTWIEYTKELLRGCHGLLRLPGKSDGADGEVAEAIDMLNIPVFYNTLEVEVAMQYWDPDHKRWLFMVSDEYAEEVQMLDEIISRVKHL